MPDYMYMLESRLSVEQRAAMTRVQELASEAHSNLYLAGGAVRDLISGMPIHDIDFTLEGNPSRIARELEKSAARIVSEDEKTRHVEIVFAGDADGSISAARDDVYARPGAKPEIRWATIAEDLHRRDFSLNAIAISLNPASRGLLLDPNNGLADLTSREVRGLSIHTFTNQPVRLLRAIRYCARMDFKLEPRTAEWFALALERQLLDSISPAEIGDELRRLTREDKPVAVLKAWEAHGLIGTIHPQLSRRHPDYEMLNRILRARDDLASAGLVTRLFAPITAAVLAKLKPREQTETLERLEYRTDEIGPVLHLQEEAQKVAKILAGSKTALPDDAFAYLEKVPRDLLVFLLAESTNSKAVNKVRNYVHKWRPLRQALPLAVAELEMLGMTRGTKFDKAIEEFFHLQLLGRARTPEDRVKLLRKLSGIREVPKKTDEKKKPDEKLKKKLMGKKGAEEAQPLASVGALASSNTGKKTGSRAEQSVITAPALGRLASHVSEHSASGQREKDERPKKTVTQKRSGGRAKSRASVKTARSSGRSKP